MLHFLSYSTPVDLSPLRVIPVSYKHRTSSRWAPWKRLEGLKSRVRAVARGGALTSSLPSAALLPSLGAW